MYACEINPTLREIYKVNFGIEPAEDIRDVNIEKIPPHDLLCAGFPCQPFSKAGAQRGWRDAIRGTVFFTIVEILERHRPEFVILENVAHFVRHDQGNTYKRVRESLEALNYTVQSEQLSPHHFGVPQIRERMYMIGRQGSLSYFQWPVPYTKSSELSVQSILDVNPPDSVALSQQVVECLDTWQEFIQTYPSEVQLPSFPVWSEEFGATYPYTEGSLHEIELGYLTDHSGSFGRPMTNRKREEVLLSVPSYARRIGINAFPKWKQKFIEKNRALYKKNREWIEPWLPKIKKFPSSLQKLEWNCKGETRDIWQYVIQFRASGVRIKRPTTSPSLVAMTSTQVPIIGWERRYMTIRECARLQSMDALKTLPTGGAARSALGNAVNVQVVKLILEKMLNVRS